MRSHVTRLQSNVEAGAQRRDYHGCLDLRHVLENEKAAGGGRGANTARKVSLRYGSPLALTAVINPGIRNRPGHDDADGLSGENPTMGGGIARF